MNHDNGRRKQGDEADERHDVARSRESAEDIVEVSACCAEEEYEHRQLREESHSREEQHHCGVDHTLCDDRPQRLRK